MTDKIIEVTIVSIDKDEITQGSFPGSDGPVKFWECPVRVSDGSKEGNATLRTYKYEQMADDIEEGQTLTVKRHHYDGKTRLTPVKKGSSPKGGGQRRGGGNYENKDAAIRSAVALKEAVQLCIATGNADPDSVRSWTGVMMSILEDAESGKIKDNSPTQDGDDVPF